MSKRLLIANALILTAISAAFFAGRAMSQQREERGRSPGLKVRENVRVVFEVSTDAWRGDVGSGLHYVARLVGLYDENEVPRDQRHIHVVVDGEAAFWLLNDDAYARFTRRQPAENPARNLIEKLLEQGVHVEISTLSMQANKWSDRDLLPGVTLLADPYLRIIDLQQQGYAYLRF